MYARPVPADGTAHVLMLCATYSVCMCGLGSINHCCCRPAHATATTKKRPWSSSASSSSTAAHGVCTVESARRASGQDAPVRRSRLTQKLSRNPGGVRHCHSHVEAAAQVKRSLLGNSTALDRLAGVGRHEDDGRLRNRNHQGSRRRTGEVSRTPPPRVGGAP